MGHYVRIGNTTDIDIARAEGIVGLVRTLNPDVKESITRFVAEFYTVWANGISGQLNFHDEAVKVGRTFKKLLDNNPDDEADLADAFCLAIRTEINRIEDEASNYIPSTGPLPDSPQEIAIWWAAQEQAQKDRAVGILWGTLPPFEEASTARNRAAFFRHKLGAAIQVYQYARNFYEGHTPKQFTLRPNLPAHYTTPPPIQPIPSEQSSSSPTHRQTYQMAAVPSAFSPFVPNGAFTVEDADEIAKGIGLIDDEGRYLGKVPNAKLCGFYSYLKYKSVLRGTLEELRDYFFERYLKSTSPTTPNAETLAGKLVAKDTEKAFKRWEKEQNQG